MKHNVIQKKFYTPKDLVNMGLGSQGKVYELFNSRDFPSFRMGAALRITVEDFEYWLEKKKRGI